MPPDPREFKKPHAWATFCTHRTKPFKTHSSLGMCKTAITGVYGMGPREWVEINGKMEYKYRAHGDSWIYRFDPDVDEWVEMYHVPDGCWPHEHLLWSNSPTNPTRKVKSVSQEAVDEAIASIMSVTRPEEAR